MIFPGPSITVTLNQTPQKGREGKRRDRKEREGKEGKRKTDFDP